MKIRYQKSNEPITYCASQYKVFQHTNLLGYVAKFDNGWQFGETAEDINEGNVYSGARRKDAVEEYKVAKLKNERA